VLELAIMPGPSTPDIVCLFLRHAHALRFPRDIVIRSGDSTLCVTEFLEFAYLRDLVR
jgi:hypothetical protein